MPRAPMRFAAAALWPVSIWFSLNHLDEHAADDYVERSSPIIAAAIGFWIVVAIIAGLWFGNGLKRIFDVMLFFLPLLYAVGFWLYTARAERYPH